MGNGKRGTAPCGHEGEHIVSQYVHCPRCDVSDGVPVHIDPEKTLDLCPHCGSDDLQVYHGFTMGGNDLWHCIDCTRTHQRPSQLDEDGA